MPRKQARLRSLMIVSLLMYTQALTFLGSGGRLLDAPRIRGALHGAETTQDFKPESPHGSYVMDHGERTVFLVNHPFTFT